MYSYGLDSVFVSVCVCAVYVFNECFVMLIQFTDANNVSLLHYNPLNSGTVVKC